MCPPSGVLVHLHCVLEYLQHCLSCSYFWILCLFASFCSGLSFTLGFPVLRSICLLIVVSVIADRLCCSVLFVCFWFCIICVFAALGWLLAKNAQTASGTLHGSNSATGGTVPRSRTFNVTLFLRSISIGNFVHLLSFLENLPTRYNDNYSWPTFH